MTGDGAHRFRLAADPRRGGPALFLDRDGTLIDDPGYLADPEAVRVYAGAAAALRRFAGAGYALVLVTNQSGIGRGRFGWEAYDAVALRLRALLAEEGVGLDAEFVCGHAPEAGHTCGWRKPAPGMIREAARLLDLDLSRSLMAGDKVIDIGAAEAAGLPRAVHVLTGHGKAERAGLGPGPQAFRLDLVDDLAALSP